MAALTMSTAKCVRLSATSSAPRPAVPVAAVAGARRARPAHRTLRPLAEPLRATPTPTVPSQFIQGADGDAEMASFMQWQASVPRPSPAEEARTVLDQGRHGVLCTISCDKATSGFPASSVVEFVCDGSGRPFFATSSLSSHTADMLADGRISLTVQSPSFQGMDCGRLTLQGTVSQVPEAEKPRLREIFLKKYPSAFYIDFADFMWFRMDAIVAARFNGGFGRMAKMTVEEYLAAKPDPVYGFSGPVCSHMNADHVDDSKAVIKHLCGMDVDSIKVLDLDRLGMNATATRKGQTFKVRLPFPHPAEDRKAIKDNIVEMTKKAKSAAATNARTPGGTI
ncbi:hypothetical protein HYH03_017454 [Edaphochlamys debaryana]|uniref:DUF2470 domain-containing protein n=1 Tax=Edaphochlamys debaryana TaxID=47281 RepID=A0A835XJY7_9CHLO|nr:hypothetical protein HYH03_017454 [Edaphochlamys debaryana]|eukprot:KAG2483651.1 hypothetical protein HYH03_017454 [Edaphochlamys debaryana]